MSLTQNGIKRFSNGILCLQAGFVYLFYLHNTYFIWMKYCFKHFSLWQIFPDTACRRKILDLTVKCSHSGCPWTGELRAVEVKRKGKLNTFELCSIILNYIIRQSNYFHSYFFSPNDWLGETKSEAIKMNYVGWSRHHFMFWMYCIKNVLSFTKNLSYQRRLIDLTFENRKECSVIILIPR